MGEQGFAVKTTQYFLNQIKAFQFSTSSGYPAENIYQLLDDLETSIIPILKQFPLIGRKFLDHPPRSAEAIQMMGNLPSSVTFQLEDIREYVQRHFVLLYLVSKPEKTCYLLSIRHHRQLSFHFEKLWR